MATVPFKLNQQNDEKGLKCMLQLFQQIAPVSNCTALHYLYPPVSRIQPPQFMIYPGNFTCFNRTGQNSRISVGQAPYCSDIIHVGSKEYPDTLFSNHLVGRADIWWYCGGKQVRQVLPSLWGGICTLIQLAQPFYILPDRSAGMMWITEKNLKRARRSVPKGSFDDRIYIDSIGIPRGVPDEFKARNQVAAGFETIISWWVTINKNVDWINYIYYNQQRFVNYTRDAVQGLAEQLDRTSLMAWQNRIALDMLLAKEGGVCKMFGTACCTFIPNNTAPDGSVTKALEGLTALSNELVENSGINDPLSKWLEDTFGKWAAYIRGILITVGTVLTLIILLGCCVIPCIRGLVNKVVDQAVTQQYLIETIPLTQGESDSYLDHDIDDV